MNKMKSFFFIVSMLYREWVALLVGLKMSFPWPINAFAYFLF